MRTVEFRGYEIDVPAGWPVYRLDLHPDQCVRYDVHAVYLGSPGSDQDCPPGLVGRTETVSIGTSSGGARPPTISQRATVGAPGAAGAGRAGAPGVILQDASLQEFGVAMPSSAPSISATYGSDPGLIEQVLASVHRVVPQLAPRTAKARMASGKPKPAAIAQAKPASPGPGGQGPGGQVPGGQVPGWPAPAGMPTGVPTAGSAWAPTGMPTGLPTAPPTPAVPTSPAVTVSNEPQAGFDTCTAPSLKAMQAWRAKFSATAIYIGGEQMACDLGNLSAAWVRATEAMGWSLLPTFVGPQAPCNSFSGKVNVKHAAAQGRQNAQWAVQDAQKLGLGNGSPIYYDMEAYNNKKARCVTAVMTFLDAWTRELNAEGYVSGVYSSAGSAVIDLATTNKVAGHPLAEPQAIWFALWDHASDLNGSPYLPGGMWPALHRSKQYAGGHWVKVRKIGLEVDSDLVNSPAVR